MAEGLIEGNRIFRISVEMTVQQQHIQFGWHLRDTVLQNATAQDAVDGAVDWVENAYRACVNANTTIDRVSATEITSRDYAQKEYNNFAGTNLQQFGSTLHAAMVSIRSPYRTRYRNGRMFWPIPEPVVNSNVPNGVLGTMNNALTAFQDRFMGPSLFRDLKVCIVCYGLAPRGKRTFTVQPSWVDASTMRIQTLATALRRRKIGVGT